MSYDFENGKKEIEEVLDSKIDVKDTQSIPDDSALSFGNGVRTWVSSIFVDIVSSSKFFTMDDISRNVKSRIIKSFIEQVVSIFNDNENVYEIGIRGDCVYAVFQAEYQKNILSVFRTAYCINTFFRMFNEILSKRQYPNISAGIGIGTGYDLIVKAGKKRIVNDKIWIGESLVNASNLSKIANRHGYDPICLDKTTYINIIDSLKKENPDYNDWIRTASSSKYVGPFYQCNIIQLYFNKWIDNGMK